MKNPVKLFFVALVLMTAFVSCKDDDKDVVVPVQKTPAEILQSTKWKTTVVRDASGADVTAANMGYVGLADYKGDGTFTISELDGKPRSNGTWALTPDGKKRILVTATFTRIADIVTLTSDLFIYHLSLPTGDITVEHVPVK